MRNQELEGVAKQRAQVEAEIRYQKERNTETEQCIKGTRTDLLKEEHKLAQSKEQTQAEIKQFLDQCQRMKREIVAEELEKEKLIIMLDRKN